MYFADKVWITELTLIHKNIRLLHNSHGQELTTSIWEEMAYLKLMEKIPDLTYVPKKKEPITLIQGVKYFWDSGHFTSFFAV